ncbi:hypothetical protein N9Y17_00890 [Gammaproteobacteria bacterium]|nr:hypothetical protein [Gammaproteobacteria bacterium]
MKNQKPKRYYYVVSAIMSIIIGVDCFINAYFFMAGWPFAITILAGLAGFILNFILYQRKQPEELSDLITKVTKMKRNDWLALICFLLLPTSYLMWSYQLIQPALFSAFVCISLIGLINYGSYSVQLEQLDSILFNIIALTTGLTFSLFTYQSYIAGGFSLPGWLVIPFCIAYFLGAFALTRSSSIQKDIQKTKSKEINNDKKVPASRGLSKIITRISNDWVFYALWVPTAIISMIALGCLLHTVGLTVLGLISNLPMAIVIMTFTGIGETLFTIEVTIDFAAMIVDHDQKHMILLGLITGLLLIASLLASWPPIVITCIAIALAVISALAVYQTKPNGAKTFFLVASVFNALGNGAIAAAGMAISPFSLAIILCGCYLSFLTMMVSTANISYDSVLPTAHHQSIVINGIICPLFLLTATLAGVYSLDTINSLLSTHFSMTSWLAATLLITLIISIAFNRSDSSSKNDHKVTTDNQTLSGYDRFLKGETLDPSTKILLTLAPYLTPFLYTRQKSNDEGGGGTSIQQLTCQQ